MVEPQISATEKAAQPDAHGAPVEAARDKPEAHQRVRQPGIVRSARGRPARLLLDPEDSPAPPPDI